MFEGCRRTVRAHRNGVLALVVLTVLALSSALLLRAPGQDGPLFPIRYVRIEGAIQNLDVARLSLALEPVVGTGYFSVSLGEIERAAKAYPWVDEVQVARIWPDTVVLSIREQKPAVRWGGHALLNQRGERFQPERVEAFRELPVLSGPVGTEGQLLGMWGRLNEKFQREGLTVAALDLSRRRAWTVRLSSGMELYFGRQEPAQALDRFLELVPKLGENRLATIQRVDLRYPNGFAVVWRPEASRFDDSSQQESRSEFFLSAKPVT
jgi:cell division protein FtsQ